MSAALGRLPWFERTAESPAVPEGVATIVLQVPAVMTLGSPASLRVSGAFQLTEADAAALPREDPFAALTLLVYEAGSARSVTLCPARSAIGPETESVPPGLRRGWFHADVLAQTGFVPRVGSCFVSAYLGPLQSQAVEVRIVQGA